MNGYVPNDPWTIFIVVLILVVVLLSGFWITRLRNDMRSRCLAWMMTISGVVIVERLTDTEPAGVRMLAIIVALLWSMKSVVCVEEQASGAPPLGWLRYAMFVVGWPGMRATAFLTFPGPPRANSAKLFRQGVKNGMAGALLVFFAWLVSRHSVDSRQQLLVISVPLLMGLSLLVHFGLFDVLAGLWRLLGADCYALFRSPLKSSSLSEFWGRRWNLAFSQMTTLTVFRPLRDIVGHRAATLAAFLFSGCLHELAISLPVRAGFGLPLLYFALHAVGVQIEGMLMRAGHPVNSIDWIGRAWTLAWLVLPLPMLFHAPFMRGCVWPLIGLEVVR